MSWRVIRGASEEVLKLLPENSIDSVVCDPPAWIDFMGRKWDTANGYHRFQKVMVECFRVLKPGGYAVVWALPRTSHYTAIGLEDAGFEIRDRIHHIFGSGMPHARDASKAIDAHILGDGWNALRPIVGEYRVGGNAGMSTEEKGGTYGVGVGTAAPVTLKRTIGATPEARERDGFFTNLKPGCEDWWMARKPLAGTMAETQLTYGTGALNIDDCRVPRDWEERGESWKASGVTADPGAEKIAAPPGQGMILHPDGGWPANIVFSHSDACEEIACAPDCPVGLTNTQAGGKQPALRYFNVFYSPKSSRKEREAGCIEAGIPVRTGGEATGRTEGSAGIQRPQAGAGRGGGRRNIHPTIKGLELMRFLLRLSTPPGGLVLDPYCGSGSTGCAAVSEGFEFLGIDEDEEDKYCSIARARITHWEKSANASR